MSEYEWRRLCVSALAKEKILCRLEECGLTELVKGEVLDGLLNPSIGVPELEDKAYEILSSTSKCSIILSCQAHASHVVQSKILFSSFVVKQ